MRGRNSGTLRRINLDVDFNVDADVDLDLDVDFNLDLLETFGTSEQARANANLKKKADGFVSSYLKLGTLGITEIIHISRSIRVLCRNAYLLGGE